tara:strand:- start:171 stop:536 length:366 start_codon:yes stop_codon:yes gene_type:complete
MDKTDTLKKAVLESLEKSLGVVTTAVKQVGIARSTFYDWMKNDQEFASQVDDINNIALDFAESQLHKQIRDGNTSATIFYLKTKGKRRGYVERQEITGADGLPNDITIEIVKSKNTDEPSL